MGCSCHAGHCVALLAVVPRYEGTSCLNPVACIWYQDRESSPAETIHGALTSHASPDYEVQSANQCFLRIFGISTAARNKSTPYDGTQSVRQILQAWSDSPFPSCSLLYRRLVADTRQAA
jgi:hypothetical protein